MKPGQVEISNDGKKIKKINSSGWFRVFGDKIWKKGTYKWILHMEKYAKGDKSGITFGVCENTIFE